MSFAPSMNALAAQAVAPGDTVELTDYGNLVEGGLKIVVGAAHTAFNYYVVVLTQSHVHFVPAKMGGLLKIRLKPNKKCPIESYERSQVSIRTSGEVVVDKYKRRSIHVEFTLPNGNPRVVTMWENADRWNSAVGG